MLPFLIGPVVEAIVIAAASAVVLRRIITAPEGTGAAGTGPAAPGGVR